MLPLQTTDFVAASMTPLGPPSSSIVIVYKTIVLFYLSLSLTQ